MIDKATEGKFVIDASELTRFVKRRDAPIWWGIIGLIVIEMTVVSCFVVTYFYLQMMNEQWPPPGATVPDAFLPTVNLVLLLISCGTMYLAGRAIDKNQIKRFVNYTVASVLLACMVLVIRWQQFDKFDVRWDEHVYGSLIWTISGFHFVHVVSAAIGTAVIAFVGTLGYFNKDRQVGVVVDTLYWNFVGFAWIPFYFVIYWAPRLI